MPEPKPRRKTGVTHISHRVAMLERALKPHSALKFLELPDKEFSVAKTMPRLKQHLPDAEMFLLIGADRELERLPTWPLAEQLLQNFGLIIAARGHDDEKIKAIIKVLPKSPRALYILKTPESEVSSEKIRKAVAKGRKHTGMLSSTRAYIDKNWLYQTLHTS